MCRSGQQDHNDQSTTLHHYPANPEFSKPGSSFFFYYQLQEDSLSGAAVNKSKIAPRAIWPQRSCDDGLMSTHLLCRVIDEQAVAGCASQRCPGRIKHRNKKSGNDAVSANGVDGIRPGSSKATGMVEM